MARVCEIEGAAVVGPGDAGLGTVAHVLFHPSEPRVVGLMVEQPAYAYVVKRQPAYLGLAQFALEDGRVVFAGKKLPPFSKAIAALGADPDRTVIWAGMPVLGPDGDVVGHVVDVEFEPTGGAVCGAEVSGGATADVAHGRVAVPADAIEGFDGSAVRVTRSFGGFEVSGGLAKTAAAGAAVVSVRASDVAGKAGDAVVGAAGAAGKAIRSVKEGSATAKVKSTWRDVVDSYKEGRDEDD